MPVSWHPEGDTILIFTHPEAYFLGADSSMTLPVLLACFKDLEICLLKCKGCRTVTASHL